MKQLLLISFLFCCAFGQLIQTCIDEPPTPVNSTTNESEVIVLQGNINKIFDSSIDGSKLSTMQDQILIIQDYNETGVYQSELNLYANDRSIISNNSVIILDSNEYEIGTITLHNNHSIIFKSDSSMNWQRGKITGVNMGGGIIFEDTTTLLLSSSTVNDEIPRYLSNSNLLLHGDIIITPDILDRNLCDVISMNYFESVPELLIELSEIEFISANVTNTLDISSNYLGNGTGFGISLLESNIIFSHNTLIDNGIIWNLEFSSFIQKHHSNIKIDYFNGEFSNILIQDDSSLFVFQEFNTNTSFITFRNNSMVFFDSNSILSIFGGRVNLFDNTSLHLSSTNITNCNFELSNNASVFVEDEYFSITFGEILGVGNSLLSLDFTNIFVQFGFITFKNNAFLLANTSNIFLSKGEIRFFDSSILQIQDAMIEVIFGQVFFNDFSILHISGTDSFTNQSLYLEKGALFTKDESQIIIDSNAHIIIFGGLVLKHNSTGVVNNSVITLEEVENCRNQEFACECECSGYSSVTVNCDQGVLIDDCRSQCFSNFCDDGEDCGECTSDCLPVCTSGLELIGGTLETDGTAKITFYSSDLNILNGFVLTEHDSQLYSYDSSVTINTGTWDCKDTANVELYNVTISVGVGSFLLEDQSSLYIDENSSFFINGDVRLNGKSSVISNTILSITSGALSFGGEINSTFSNSSISLDGTGSILTYNTSNIDIIQSNVEIIGGAVELYNSSKFIVDIGSSINIDIELFSRHSSSVEIIESDMSVNGKITTSDNAHLLVNSSFVNVGNVDILNGIISGIIIKDSATLNINDAVINLNDGSWIGSHNSDLVFTESSINILGMGSFLLEDQSSLYIDENSSFFINGDVRLNGKSSIISNTILSITSGALSFGGEINSTFSNSSISLDGIGSILTYNTSNIDIIQSNVEIIGGAVELYNSSKFIVDIGSSINIDIELFSRHSSSVEIIESDMYVNGKITTSDNAHLLVNSSFVNVGNVNILNGIISGITIKDSATLNVNDAIINLNDGSWIGSHNSDLVFTESSINILGMGSFLLEDQSSLYIGENSSFFINGDVRLNGKSSVISNTILSITSGALSFGGEINSIFSNASISLDGTGSILTYNTSNIEIIQSNVEIIGGAIELYNSSKFIVNDDSSINIDIELFSRHSSSVEIIESDMYVNGKITTSDNAHLLVNSSFVNVGNVDILNGIISGITIKDSATLNVNDAVINLNDGSWIGSHNSDLVITESSINILGMGSFLLEDQSSLYIDENSSFFINGDVRLNGKSSVISNTILSITSGALSFGGEINSIFSNASISLDGIGSILTYNTSNIDIISSNVEIIGGAVELYNSSKFIVNDDSSINIDIELFSRHSSSVEIIESDMSVNGKITTSDNAHLLVKSSFVNVGNVNILNGIISGIIIKDSATLNVNDAVINLNDGSWIGSHNSNLVITESSINILGTGSFLLQDQSTFTQTESEFFVSGDLLLGGRSSNILDSSITIGEGRMIFKNSINSYFKFVNVHLDGSGSITGQDNSNIVFISSDLFISQGALDIVDSGHFDIKSHSSITIGSSLILQNAGNFIVEESELFVQGNINILDSSIMDVNLSVIHVGESGGSDFSSSVILSQNSNLIVNSTQVTLFDGFWEGNDNSTIQYYNSRVLIEGGGAFTLLNLSKLVQIQSLLYIFGDISLGGSLAIISNSDIIVGDDGILSFSKSSNSIISDSMISLNGTGNINSLDQSIIQIINSDVIISHGAMILSDECQFSIESNSFFEIGSSLISEDFSILTIDSSELVIFGTVEMNNESEMKLFNSQVTVGTNIDLSSGNVILRNSTKLTIEENSVMSLTGNLDISSNATIRVIENSEINIEGNGYLSISNEAELYISNNSTVFIINGTIILTENGKIELSDSSKLINNDILNFEGDASVILPQGNEFKISDKGEVIFHKTIDITTNNNENTNEQSFIDNHGILDMRETETGNINVPVENKSGGLFAIGNSNLKMDSITNSGKLYFQSSNINLLSNNNVLEMKKGSTSQGKMFLNGNFMNEGAITHDEDTGSLFEISGEYTSTKDSIIYITIEDPKKPGDGYTFVDIKQLATLNGIIEICIPENAKLGDMKSIDLLQFGSRNGKFKEIIFNCSPEHKTSSYSQSKELKKTGTNSKQMKSSLKLMKSVEDGCTSTEYTSGSFAVLLDGCSNNSNSNEKYLYVWLSLGFVGLAILLIIIVLAMVEFIPPVNRIVLGAEGSRIKSVRKKQVQYRKSSAPTLPPVSIV